MWVGTALAERFWWKFARFVSEIGGRRLGLTLWRCNLSVVYHAALFLVSLMRRYAHNSTPAVRGVLGEESGMVRYWIRSGDRSRSSRARDTDATLSIVGDDTAMWQRNQLWRIAATVFHRATETPAAIPPTTKPPTNIILRLKASVCFEENNSCRWMDDRLYYGGCCTRNKQPNSSHVEHLQNFFSK